MRHREADDFPATTARQVQGLGLWRVDPPSIPKGSSERGAEQAKRFAKNQTLAILRALLARTCFEDSDIYLSRDDIMGLVPGLTVNSATGRLGPSGQMQTMQYITSTENAARSNAGNKVDGYQITKAGRDYVAKWRNT